MGYLGENLAMGSTTEVDPVTPDPIFDALYPRPVVQCDAAQFIDLSFVLEVE